MRKSLSVLAVIFALLAVALPAQAGTTTNGDLTITATDQVMQPSCYHYTNVSYAANAAHWSLTVEILKTGAMGDSSFVSGEGPGSGTLSTYLCDSLDGAGTYTVHAVLSPYDADYNPLPLVVADTTFALAAPPVATTLGIAVVTKTSHGTITTLSRGKTACVGVRLLRGTHYLNRARVTLQAHLSHHAWHNVTTRTTATMAGHKGMSIVKARLLHTTYFRWVYAGSSTSKASRSASRKIRVI